MNLQSEIEAALDRCVAASNRVEYQARDWNWRGKVGDWLHWIQRGAVGNYWWGLSAGDRFRKPTGVRSIGETLATNNFNCTVEMYSSLCYNLAMPETISSTKLRANLKDALRHVKESKQPLIITERGAATSVILDIAEYEDVLMSHDKQAVAELHESIAQKKRGEVVSFESVFADIL